MKLNNNKKSVKISRSLFMLYAVMVCGIVFALPAFAASDPLVVVENLSTFIFSLIRAVGLILLGWGIVQVGLCDEFLYLGGTEKETHKYVSELLGKETISTTSYNQSKGRSGSYSINHQQSGRDLMTPDEVRLLDNSKCILFIRGERPVVDYKYNLLKHPNIRYTEDGGVAPYDYTAADNARDDLPGAPENYELLDMDDFLPAEAAEMKPTIQRIRRST